VDKAVELELVKGYPDGTFQPNKTVSRAEGVAIMTRFDHLSAQEVELAPFLDVSLDHWAVNSVAAAQQAGLLDYLRAQQFRPGQALTRAEVAEMLAKTTFIKDQLR
jgi:hypothetical protein